MIKEQEIPKHKKKKKSSTSDAKTKSKHKHDYSGECLIRYKTKHYIGNEERDYYSHSRCIYCIICGKIRDHFFWETERLDDGRYRTLTQEEVLDKYKHLSIIYYDDSPYDLKYIPVSKSD